MLKFLVHIVVTFGTNQPSLMLSNLSQVSYKRQFRFPPFFQLNFFISWIWENCFSFKKIFNQRDMPGIAPDKKDPPDRYFLPNSNVILFYEKIYYIRISLSREEWSVTFHHIYITLTNFHFSYYITLTQWKKRRVGMYCEKSNVIQCNVIVM